MSVKNNQLENNPRILPAVGTAPSTSTGEGVFYPKDVSGIAEGFYKDDQGNEIQLTSNGSINVIGAGEANTASNVGSGAGQVFKQKTGVDLEFRNIAAGSNVTVAVVGDNIEISAPAPSGEVNTASNVGAGNQVFKQKSGADLEFRTLVAGSNVTLVSGTDTITISAAGGGGGSLQVQDEGSLVDNAVTTLNFTGAGVTAAQTSPGVVQVAVSGGGSGESNTASNLGGGEGAFAQKSGVDLQFKSLVAGSNVSLTSDSNTITINASGAAGESNTASNLAGDEGIFTTKSGVDLPFKSLTAGSGISLSSDANTITISSPGGTGEANTSSNLGAGEGLASAKSGLDLPFKSLVAGTNVSLTSDANTVTINATGGGSGETNTASNVGAGSQVFKQKSGVDLEMRTLTAGSNVTLTQNADTIEIAASGGGGGVLTEFVIQLGAGATIADKVAAAPTGGVPAGLTIVDGTNGSVDPELSGAVADMVIIHNEAKVAISVEAIGEGPVFTPTFDQKMPSSSAAGFPPGTMATSSNGNQTRITGWNTAVGSNNQRTWTVIRLAPILT